MKILKGTNYSKIQVNIHYAVYFSYYIPYIRVSASYKGKENVMCTIWNVGKKKVQNEVIKAYKM